MTAVVKEIHVTKHRLVPPALLYDKIGKITCKRPPGGIITLFGEILVFPG
jgi:hypothetical protein